MFRKKKGKRNLDHRLVSELCLVFTQFRRFATFSSLNPSQLFPPPQRSQQTRIKLCEYFLQMTDHLRARREEGRSKNESKSGIEGRFQSHCPKSTTWKSAPSSETGCPGVEPTTTIPISPLRTKKNKYASVGFPKTKVIHLFLHLICSHVAQSFVSSYNGLLQTETGVLDTPPQLLITTNNLRIQKKK